jgi:L-threonylcarbamoyladenylate synthase
MNTRIYTKQDLEKIDVQKDIKKTLLNGGNVIFPTETVYGIGAYALSEDGILGIYKVKGRPSDNPLIMHVAHEKDVYKYTKEHQPYVKDLMKAFWPGPMTLVLKKQDQVPTLITGGLDTVGIRIPNHDVALKVIDIAGVAICAPSANISGKPSSTLFEHVIEDFKDRVDIIIDDGKSRVGLESTVIDATKEEPIILRPGMITKQMIEKVIGKVLIKKDVEESEIPKAPGMKYRHYAPKGELIIIKGDLNHVIKYINKETKKHQNKGLKVGVICTKEIKNEFLTPYVYALGDASNEIEIASNLFSSLRELDKNQINQIYSIEFKDGPYSEAIMNRLIKAANHHVVNLDHENQ